MEKDCYVYFMFNVNTLIGNENLYRITHVDNTITHPIALERAESWYSGLMEFIEVA